MERISEQHYPGNHSSGFHAIFSGRKKLVVLNIRTFSQNFDIFRLKAGLAADAGHGVDVIVAAQRGEALDLCSSVNGRAVADADLVLDDDEGTDGHAGAQGRSGMYDRRRVDCRLHQSSLGTTDAVRMPSATTLPSTMALPLVFHIMSLWRS